QNNNSAPVHLTEMRLRVHMNSDEHAPTSSDNDPALVSSPPDQSEANFINYDYSSGTPLGANVTIIATYQSSTPPLTDDDIYRVAFKVGGAMCSVSDIFPATAAPGVPPQLVTVTILKPASAGEVISDGSSASQFEATASSSGGAII